MSFYKRLMLGLVCAAIAAVPTTAQTDAGTAPQSTSTVPAQIATGGTKVHGIITDPDGELIPGATITFTPTHGAAKKVTSGSDGTYSTTIAPGTYTLVVSMKGFASYSMLNLKVPAVPSTTVDAKLKIGEETEVVNVEANAIQLSVDPDANASASVISGKDLDALSDDPDELSSELQALAGPSAGPNGGQIYVDGFTGGQLPPKSSIREIRINQNPFSAQFDRLGYGRIEVFTKPGTDKLHGSFQINGAPSQLNSGNPLEAGLYQPPYHTIFMFGSLTGPISKNASYSVGGSHRDIEDDQFTNATILALPGTTTLCQPGNAACTATPQLQASTYYPQIRTDISPRLDLAFGTKNVLTTRFQYVQNDATNEGIGGLTLPSAGSNADSKNFELQMSDTQTYSSRLINETRFEYERDRSTTTALSNAATVGVQGAFTAGGSSGQNSSDHQDRFEVQNYTSLQLKKNFLRMGGRLRTEREALNTQGGTNGYFTYAGLTYTNQCTLPNAPTPCTPQADHSYQTGTPEQFSYTVVNVPKIGYTYADLGIYLETDWKARQNLTVSYGFRYETQNHLGDHHDVAPRVSFAYGLGSAKGAPKVVLRGGFGLFYDRFGAGNILTLQRENGANETVFTQTNVPAGCNPSSFATSKANCTNGAAVANAVTTYSTTPNLRTPYIIQEAAGLDKQLGRYGTVSANYIHSQGVHQLATQNSSYNLTTHTSNGVNYQYFSEGVFNQNQLTVNARVQTSKWLSLFGYYALNSAHGDTSGAGAFITTPGNIAADYGRTTFSVRNRIFMAGSVTLPHFIQFSPFLLGQSGNPYNITAGNDLNGDTILTDRPYLANGLAPNGTTIKTIAGCGTFEQPTPGAAAPAGLSVVPINYCTGPALFSLNFRLTKTWGFGESRVKPPAGGGGGPGGGGPPGGAGNQRRGAGGGPGGSSGGLPMFGGGGGNTGKRYNVSVGVTVQNLFNNEDLSTPIGTLTSPEFGQSTQLANGPYTSSAALRRIGLQASITF